jgi:hypothetical protein
MGAYEETVGLSSPKEARRQDATNQNITSYNVSVDSGTKKYVISYIAYTQKLDSSLSFNVCHEKAKCVRSFRSRCFFGRLARAMAINEIFQIFQVNVNVLQQTQHLVRVENLYI